MSLLLLPLKSRSGRLRSGKRRLHFLRGRDATGKGGGERLRKEERDGEEREGIVLLLPLKLPDFGVELLTKSHGADTHTHYSHTLTHTRSHLATATASNVTRRIWSNNNNTNTSSNIISNNCSINNSNARSSDNSITLSLSFSIHLSIYLSIYLFIYLRI